MTTAEQSTFADAKSTPVVKAERIDSLQVLRGVASIAVVVYHVHVIAEKTNIGLPVLVDRFANHGALGVNLFFILSGFVILLAHRRDIGVSTALGRYLYRRFVRLFPIYWIFSLFYIAAAVVGFGEPDFSWHPWNLVQTVLLIDLTGDLSLPLKVAWSLVYEIRFYLLFAVLILSYRWGMVVFAVWTLGIALSLAGLNLGFEIFNAWNAYFLIGMGIQLVYRRVPRLAAPAILLAGLAVLLAYAAQYNMGMAQLQRGHDGLLLLLGVGFGLLVLGCIAIERHYTLSMPAFLMFLGDASYSIYLTHSAGISFLAIILKKLGLAQALDPWIMFLLLFILPTIAGMIAYVVLEKPLLDRLRRAGSGARH